MYPGMQLHAVLMHQSGAPPNTATVTMDLNNGLRVSGIGCTPRRGRKIR